MSEPLKELTRFAIFPPTDLKDEEIFDFTESIAKTPQDAWDKFCYPALRQEAYENDGFEATELILKVYVK